MGFTTESFRALVLVIASFFTPKLLVEKGVTLNNYAYWYEHWRSDTGLNSLIPELIVSCMPDLLTDVLLCGIT